MRGTEHRYELNNEYREILEKNRMVFIGIVSLWEAGGGN